MRNFFTFRGQERTDSQSAMTLNNTRCRLAWPNRGPKWPVIATNGRRNLDLDVKLGQVQVQVQVQVRHLEIRRISQLTQLPHWLG